jgi:hypothetical protein
VAVAVAVVVTLVVVILQVISKFSSYAIAYSNNRYFDCKIKNCVYIRMYVVYIIYSCGAHIFTLSS